MAVPATILGILDRVAAGREAQRGGFASGDDFWTRVDAADDETYENRVKGSSITAIDTALPLGGGWGTTTLKKLFTLHDEYINTDLGLTTSPRLGAWLAAQGWRIGYYAALAHEEAMQAALAAAQVFAPGVRPADEADPSSSGMHLFGTYASAAITEVDGAVPAAIGPAGILAVNLSGSQTVGATFRCTWGTGASDYKDLALSLSTAAQYTQTILGEEALDDAAAADQAVVPLGATAAFVAGMQALIWESDDLQEVGTIESVQTDTSITLTASLVHSFTAAAVAIPLFRSVAYQSGASGSGSVRLYALPDRTVAL